jgi:muramidase (phage lysozyme)
MLLDVDDVLVTLWVARTSPVLRIQSGRKRVGLSSLGPAWTSLGGSGFDDLGASGDLQGMFSLTLLSSIARMSACPSSWNC